MKKFFKYFVILFCIVVLGVVVITAIIESSKKKSEIENVPNESNLNLILENSTIENKLKSYETEQVVDVPVSNSKSPAGSSVFKKFYIKENDPKLNLDCWEEKKLGNNKNKLYLKKITNFGEYKKIMDNYPSLRPLIETDFENYFAVLVITDDDKKSLNFNRLIVNESEKEPILNISMSYTEETETDLQYSGLVIIMTNWHKDFPLNPLIEE